MVVELGEPGENEGLRGFGAAITVASWTWS